MVRFSLIPPALVAALVGFGSTIALVLAAATALGASPDETASWVLVVCLAKAAGTALLSYWSRIPILLAWSTPAAALIASTQGITMAEGAGVFVLSGLMIALTGLVRPLGRLVAAIPDGVAAGMLAGILLPFVLRTLGAAEALPHLVLPMIAVFLLVRLWNPAMAILAALGLGLALPIVLVTMAGQNLPGFATLRSAGYEAPVSRTLTVTGVLSALSGLFAAHPNSVAAITAAICLGPEVHPDKDQRWKVGLSYAGFWALLGLASPQVIAVLTALPAPLLTAIVGLALIGPLVGALTGAFAAPKERFAGTVTLVVTAAGLSFAGIGAAFWGLLAGIAIVILDAARTRLAR